MYLIMECTQTETISVDMVNIYTYKYIMKCVTLYQDLCQESKKWGPGTHQVLEDGVLP